MATVNREAKRTADPMNDDLTIRTPRVVDTADELTDRLEDMAYVMRRVGDWLDVYGAEQDGKDTGRDLMACAGLMRLFSRDLSEAGYDLGNRIYFARRGQAADF